MLALTHLLSRPAAAALQSVSFVRILPHGQYEPIAGIRPEHVYFEISLRCFSISGARATSSPASTTATRIASLPAKATVSHTQKQIARQMGVGWRCSSFSLTLLLVYAVSSLVFLRPPLHSVGPTTSTTTNSYDGNNDHDHHWGREPRIRSASGADSIVFIALGPAARSTSLLYALTSLREEGRWDGAVHVIVQHEEDLDCLSSYLRQSVTAIAIAPPTRSGGSSGRGRGRDGRSHSVFTGGGDLEANTNGALGPALGAARRGTETAEEAGRVGAAAEAGGAAAVVESALRGDGGDAIGTGNGDQGYLHDGGRGKPGGVVVNNAKMAKMQLLDLLPPSVERVVYVDCDVITQRPLGPFLDSVAQAWNELDRKAEAAAAAASAVAEKGPATTGRSTGSDRLPLRLQGESVAERPTSPVASNGDKKHRPLSSSSSTVIIFQDAGGHTIPACWGCDGAHSGVVALARGHSERCLELWHDAFRGESGKRKGTATDQEALDVALRQGSGCEARWMGRQHLSFMKDALVMAGLTRTSTFGHFTGLLHPEKLGTVYRRFYEWALGRGFKEWGQGEIEACAVGW